MVRVRRTVTFHDDPYTKDILGKFQTICNANGHTLEDEILWRLDHFHDICVNCGGLIWITRAMIPQALDVYANHVNGRTQLCPLCIAKGLIAEREKKEETASQS